MHLFREASDLGLVMINMHPSRKVSDEPSYLDCLINDVYLFFLSLIDGKLDNIMYQLHMFRQRKLYIDNSFFTLQRLNEIEGEFNVLTESNRTIKTTKDVRTLFWKLRRSIRRHRSYLNTLDAYLAIPPQPR